MTDNTTSESKQRTITLTDRPPVRVKEDQWPLIAHGAYNEFQANRTRKIDFRVRRHQDGRAIVYGVYDYDTRFQGEKCEAHKVGALLAPDDDLPTGIKEAAKQMIERIRSLAARHTRAAADDDRLDAWPMKAAGPLRSAPRRVSWRSSLMN